jgi:hypothetical protein
VGLRDAEEEHYRASVGDDFDTRETEYRRGFTAALQPRLRGRVYEEALDDLRGEYSDACEGDAFQCGYRRGVEYLNRTRQEE